MVAEMGNPHEPGRISVTIKQDGKDATWVVYHGSIPEVKRQIIETFDLEEEGLSLADLITEATRQFKATGNVSSQLGGRVIPKGDSAPKGGGNAWAEAANTPAEDPVDLNVVRLQKAIEAAESVQSLKELFARDKAHFDANPDLLAEWKAKGKSLSS